VEFSPLENMPYYAECSPLVEGLGYRLVELRLFQRKGETQVHVAIQSKDGISVIGLEDCSKVHRTVQQRLEVLTGNRDISMEVTSPGMERHIKNAAEFPLFAGRAVRVWDTSVPDWVSGSIVGASKDFLALEIPQEGVQSIPLGNIAKAKLV
jgi:ribosome maturation factor RimP